MSRFSDIDLNFEKNPFTNDVNVLTNTDGIKRSVRNLVLYNFFEKPFKPRFGGNTKAKLFENANALTAIDVQEQIENVINESEPRVSLNDVIVIPNIDQNGFNVSINFTPINTVQPVILQFALERAR
jgi:phage baseplate assembly protein W|tara:strand:+ start:226 stop:606 length:381 start_codon:yes stop_codon:yes gene_type:complete